MFETLTLLKRYDPGKDGYIRVRLADGRVIEEHRLVMAATLGRELESWEIVRHLDRDRGNNAPANLMLDTRGAPDTGERRAPHRVALVCSHCGGPFERPVAQVNLALKRGKTRFFCGHACVGQVFGRGKVAQVQLIDGLNGSKPSSSFAS